MVASGEEMWRNRVKQAGDHICAWWKESFERSTHWDEIGYRQGLRDCLVILKKHNLIDDYSMISGVTLPKKGGD